MEAFKAHKRSAKACSIDIDPKERKLLEAIKMMDSEIKKKEWAKPIDKNYTSSSILVVGGWIRDKILKKESSEIDIVVQRRLFEFTRKFLCSILEEVFGRGTKTRIVVDVHEVKSCQKKRFCLAVKPLNEADILVDVSDSKTCLLEDYKSRDFTCNAIYFDPLDDHVLFVEKSEDLLDKPKDRSLATVDELSKVMTLSRSIRAIRFKYALGLKLEFKLGEFLKSKARVYFLKIASKGVLRTLWREVLKLADNRELFADGISTLFKYEMLPTSIGKVSFKNIKPLRYFLFINFEEIKPLCKGELLENFVYKLHEMIDNFRTSPSPSSLSEVIKKDETDSNLADSNTAVLENMNTIVTDSNSNKEEACKTELISKEQVSELEISEEEVSEEADHNWNKAKTKTFSQLIKKEDYILGMKSLRKKLELGFHNLGDDVEDMLFANQSPDIDEALFASYGPMLIATNPEGLNSWKRITEKLSREMALINSSEFYRTDPNSPDPFELKKPSKYIAKNIASTINKIRNDPQSFIPHLEKILPTYSSDGMFYRDSTGVACHCSEGKPACLDAIRFLETQKSLDKLEFSTELSKVAQEFFDDFFYKKERRVIMEDGWFNSEGKTIVQKCSEYIPIGGDFGEFKILQSSTALDFILKAIISDHRFTRDDRKIIFGQNYKYIGVGFIYNEEGNQTFALVIMVETIGKKAKTKPLSFPNKIFSEIPSDIYDVLGSLKKTITDIKRKQVKEGKTKKNLWTLKYISDEGKECTISKISNYL